MKFSQLGTLVGEHFKQGKGAFLNTSYGGLFSPSWAEVKGVNATARITPNGISFIVDEASSNTRVMLLIPSELFSNNTNYRILSSSNYQLSKISVGEATNFNDTSTYKVYRDGNGLVPDGSDDFALTEITKEYVCVYFYASNAPVGTQININQLSIIKID